MMRPVKGFQERIQVPNFHVVFFRAFINTHLLIHKHVKISVDEWILETTHPQKHVKFLEFYTTDFNK